jgi:flagellar hook-length control protein FliK
MTTAVQPAAPPGPVVKGSGGPPGPDHPPDTGFDRVLDQHEQARTATAEGHKKDKADADASGGSSQDQSTSGDDATSSTAMGPNATVTPTPALPVVAVLPVAVPDASLQLPAAPTVDPGAVVADPNVAAAATDGQPAAGQLAGVAPPAPAPVVDPAASFAVGAAVTVAPTGSTGPAAPTAAIVPDAATVAGQLPVGAVPTDPTATVTATPTATGPVADAGAPVADPQAAANAPAGMPIPATPDPTAVTAAVGTPAAAASAAASDASAPPATAPPATDATSATTEAPAAPPTPVGTPITAARLHDARALAPAPIRVAVGEAVEGLRDLMELATSRGASHARLVLHPAEFGGVEIRLRQSSQGLQATVTAEHPDALASLERGGADLKRQLEARGVTVASLEFGLSPQQDGSNARHGLNGAFGSTGSRTTGLGDEEGDDPSLLVGAVATSPNLSPTTAGSLLDVLA